MIDLKFGLFWSGAKLSYLRYLTFKTLRHFHPNSIIELYTTDTYYKDDLNWRDEKQDFQDKSDIKDYLQELNKLGVQFKKFDEAPLYAPNYQSDIFRWEYLSKNSGFYLDTDQIIMKSFSSLPLDVNFIYSEYLAKTCGVYTPVGVLGADNSEIVSWTKTLLPQFYQKDNYNSIGPFMFRAMLRMKNWRDKMYNAASTYFYPISESYRVNEIYNGSFIPNSETICTHWFGGHPLSQEFNKKYTEEFAKKSNDSISVFLRKENLL